MHFPSTKYRVSSVLLGWIWNCEAQTTMTEQEREILERALREMTSECDTPEKAIALFQSDGYFDETGRLAKEYRHSE